MRTLSERSTKSAISKTNNVPLSTSDIQQRISTFLKKNDLKSDAIITIQPMSNDDNSFKMQDQVFSLEGMEPISIFTNDATYTFNDVEKGIPTINVYSRNDEEEFLLVTKSKEGTIKRISTTNKKNGRHTEIAPILPGIYAIIKEEDIDYEELNRKFTYGEKHDVRQTVISKLGALFHPVDRSLQVETECNTYDVLELAVAYESSFCARVEGQTEEASVNEVISIVSAVNQKYEQPGLCVKVVLSHLEGFCDPQIDPYKQYVELNLSGCGCEAGLLDGFEQFWESKRASVKRDVAHLFSGTSLECNDACKVGCSWTGGLCSFSTGYGVNNALLSDNANLRAVLIAHELGHNVGASHSQEGYIMAPAIHNAPNGFAPEIIDVMKNSMAVRACTDTCSSESCCFEDSECDNGLFCDGPERCINFECVSVGLPCDDNNFCTQDLCEESTQTCSSLHVDNCCRNQSECDNSKFCDRFKLCINNQCIPVNSIPCDDKDPCTIDICIEESRSCSYEFNEDCLPSSTPSEAPSISANPSISMNPSLFPTTSSMPSVSSEPSLFPTPKSSSIPSVSSEPSLSSSSEPSSIPSVSSEPSLFSSSEPSSVPSTSLEPTQFPSISSIPSISPNITASKSS